MSSRDSPSPDGWVRITDSWRGDKSCGDPNDPTFEGYVRDYREAEIGTQRDWGNYLDFL
jgi:hypothetical protein